MWESLQDARDALSHVPAPERISARTARILAPTSAAADRILRHEQGA